MIAVFDTNVLISALLTEGICSKLLGRARRGQFSLAVCPFILEETERVLLEKFFISKREILEARQIIREAVSVYVEHVEKVSSICRDKDDNKVLACAQSSKADYLVTGDDDLIALKQFYKVKIVSPRDFENLF